MAMKVLNSEGNELRIRITDEDHTSLQLFRIRLNAHSDVDYANFFTGHPDLDEPELYIRVKKGKNAVKVLKSVCSTIDSDFGSLSL
jgi:DNA-directed RNA polymerase subunit L